jgi:tetratricopeptide (TPR) repeat protein
MAEIPETMKRHPSWQRIAPFLAFSVIALALRVWSVFGLASNPRIDTPTRDCAYYFDLARQVAAGSVWPSDPLFMGQLYPFLLSGLFRIAPPEVLTIQIFQSLLGLATLALLVLTVRRQFGLLCASFSAGIYIFYGPILASESMVLMESIMLFLATAALFFWPHQRRRLITALLFGLTCGLLAVGRASFLLLPLIAVITLLRSGVAASARSRAISLSLLVLIGATLPIIPQAIHQTRATGRPGFLTLNGGMNLYVGNNHLARGIFSAPPEMDLNDDFTARRSASVLAGRKLSLYESSTFWRNRAVAEIKSDPGDFLVLLGRKALLFFAPAEIPQIYNFQILAEQAPALKIAFIRFGYLLPLALAGLFYLIRLRRRNVSEQKPDANGHSLIPVLVLIAVGWAQTIIFFATGRYRIDVLPAFIVLGAVGLTYLVEQLRKKQIVPVMLTCAIIAGLFFAPAGYPVAKAKAYDAYYLGLKQSNMKAYPEALARYHDAINADPGCGEAWHGAGTALYHLQRYPEAIENYLEALERMPRSAITHFALGLCYLRSGNYQQASIGFQQAVRLNPRNPMYHYQLGNALYQVGNRDAAKQSWQTTLQLTPNHKGAREQLQRFF